jgi:drug/metabolite transporter (DMT)-like permease
MHQTQGYKPYFALAATCLIWGTTYLVSKIGVQNFPPLYLAFFRQLIGGSLILSFSVFIKKENILDKNLWIQQGIIGFFMVTLGNGLSTFAVKFVPSGLAALMGALSPIFVLLIDFFLHKIKHRWQVWVGVLLGLFGVILMSNHSLNFTGNMDWWALIAIAIACLAWSLGTIYTKRKPLIGSVSMRTGLMMLLGGFWIFPFALFFENSQEIIFTQEVVFALGYLVLFGSVIAFNAFNYSLKHLPVSLATIYTYINPGIALVAGWLVLGEILDFQNIVACSICLLGVFVVAKYGNK